MNIEDLKERRENTRVKLDDLRSQATAIREQIYITEALLDTIDHELSTARKEQANADRTAHVGG